MHANIRQKVVHIQLKFSIESLLALHPLNPGEHVCILPTTLEQKLQPASATSGRGKSLGSYLTELLNAVADGAGGSTFIKFYFIK